MPQRRLLSHLAQFGSFARQGELLCTQGLLYLLQHAEATAAAVELFNERLARVVDPGRAAVLPVDLHWLAEAIQEDHGRPDLEARSPDGQPRVKVEAKLDAPFGDGQLRSYANDFAQKGCEGVLIVLVPGRRIVDVRSAAGQQLGCVGDGPWSVGATSPCFVSVVSWEDVIQALGRVSTEPFAGDLANFAEMYRVLIGDSLEPVRSIEELRAWQDAESKFIALVSKVTERLTVGKLMPLGRDIPDDPGSYYRRYVCLKGICVSIGVRAPFRGHDTPIWMRFHKKTSGFDLLRARLLASPFSGRIVNDGGHVWMPLSVPLGADTQEMINVVASQASDFMRAAGMLETPTP